MQAAIGLAGRANFIVQYLRPALDAGLVEMTIADKPNRRLEVNAHSRYGDLVSFDLSMTPPEPSVFWELFLGVLGNALWTVLTAMIGAVYWLSKQRAQFGGRWRATIRWQMKWAEHYLIGEKAADAHSDGEISLSFGSGPERDRYWGLSVWRLRNGTTDLAELCVELREFSLKKTWSLRPPFLKYSLSSTWLNSRIRREVGTFRYPTQFANYRVTFSKSNRDQLAGVIEASKEGASPFPVGTFSAERIS